jgi:ribonuclease HI
MTVLWTYTAWNPHGGHGGWAYAARGETTAGAAGGERATTAERMALTAALRALQALGGAKAAALHTPSRALADGAAALPAWRAARWRDETGAAVADADLWAALDGLLTASGAEVRAAPSPPAGSPSAFVAAWAEFALGKVKATGPFAAPIPKPNLLKFPG